MGLLFCSCVHAIWLVSSLHWSAIVPHQAGRLQFAPVLCIQCHECLPLGSFAARNMDYGARVSRWLDFVLWCISTGGFKGVSTWVGGLQGGSPPWRVLCLLSFALKKVSPSEARSLVPFAQCTTHSRECTMGFYDVFPLFQWLLLFAGFCPCAGGVVLIPRCGVPVKICLYMQKRTGNAIVFRGVSRLLRFAKI